MNKTKFNYFPLNFIFAILQIDINQIPAFLFDFLNLKKFK